MTKDIENEIQSWIAVRSFAVEDANPQAPIIDANELAEFVTEVFKKLEGCVVVPESELKDTFYWPDSEYVVDRPFDYDFELDKGEIQAIEKWKRTKSTKVYFANIYKDDESFEITEFKSLEEAQDAVKENNAYLEAQEFFNLAEAARGGNEN